MHVPPLTRTPRLEPVVPRCLGRQVALGTYSTRQEALDAIAEARSDATRGRFVAPMGSRTCVDAIVEAWWQTREGHRASTRDRDRTVLDNDVLPIFGQAQLVEITHEEVQAWVDRLAVRLAPSSVQRSFTVLRQVLGFAMDGRLLAANPSDRTRLPRRQPFEAHFLTPDELELLASSIDPRYRAMVLVMAWGTLRIGEAMGLRRTDLDFGAGRLRIANNLVEVSGKLYEGPPKTKAGRRSMSLPSSVVAELRLHVARYGGSPYVFTSRSCALLHAAEWRNFVWRPAVNTAELTPLRLETHWRRAARRRRRRSFGDCATRRSQLGRVHLRPLRASVSRSGRVGRSKARRDPHGGSRSSDGGLNSCDRDSLPETHDLPSTATQPFGFASAGGPLGWMRR